MVTIRRKVLGNKAYYYLEHSVRRGEKVEKKERYIGKTIPKDIERLKAEFLYQIFKERWFPALDEIRKDFARQRKSMPGSAAEKETEDFSVRFTYDSQRIEGSRLTLRETADLLEGRTTPKGKPLRDAKEAEAHQGVFYEMLRYEGDISLQKVLHWHSRLFETTKPDIAGKIRQHQVLIAGSRFIPPLPVEVYPLLKQFFKWYEKSRDSLHPVELAALTHLKFVTVHPFTDGNGRISRLLMNFILKKRDFPMLNIPYQDRSSYYNALERAQVNQQDSIFLQWFFRRYLKENRKYHKDKRPR